MGYFFCVVEHLLHHVSWIFLAEQVLRQALFQLWGNDMQDKMDTAESNSPPLKFELTPRERRTLKAFQAQYKLRFLTKAFLVVTLLYCVGVGSVSVFYAYEVFTGGRSMESIEAGNASPEAINEKAAEFLPFIQNINFFGLGWTQILHALLLFYIASRSFRALYRLWHRTPRAKLALKLARRLEELGELDLSE